MVTETLDIKDINKILYKPQNECDSFEKKIQWAVLEKSLGLQYGKPDFYYFLTWCKIISTPTLENPGGLIPFQVLPHNREYIDALLSKRLISVMKSRQIWISYTTAVWALWFVMAHRGAHGMLFSKGEKEAFELLGKAYRIYKHLPPIFHFKQKPDSLEEMGFPSLESSLKAFPSTESSGISYTASFIVSDEHLQHPYDKENYTSAKPTIETIGGQYISIFTPDKRKLDKLAVSLWRGAPDNGFYPLFFDYNVIPGRGDVWYDAVNNNLTAEELEGLSPEVYMESNYPRSVDEALRTPQTVSAFDSKVLDNMDGEKTSIVVSFDGYNPSIMNIYYPFFAGNAYIAGSDTSHGVGKDNSVTVIMNARTGVIVADIMNSRLSPEEFALHSVNLLKYYQAPIWFIEDNDWGRVVISTAQSLGYRNLGFGDERKTKVGWHTDERTRVDLWGGLMSAINSGQIPSIPNPDGKRQFYDIIRNSLKNGRIEARRSRHDDYPMTVGICWAKRNEVRFETSMAPLETLTFKQEVPDAVRKWMDVSDATRKWMERK